MTDIKAIRDEEKRKYHDYRVRAAQIYGGHGMQVQPHGGVWPVDGGAFVEMVAWVPNVVALEREPAAVPELEK